mmetsp:Transcript_41780/g.96764  ORF Transcript_41780/g.96764 Transcript_41780/m.96764 type:complete len:271 (+) Transcript_41780:48-860(+)|eukprot:CAMPEP_0171070146 /NCGR_PEP_ID=MMETSP0766_2-20121228/9573_1 /TAXON_ID=439317 /ORGANISM="Gambierdiscus australes, Strain CAWD 149" /LENGTH=270 /DNA_ID=CAMNT_0011526589 /DNA_START=41 /DNA_END=853 /DNA_ORIENTATION=-
MAPVAEATGVLKKLPLHMGDLERLRDEHIIDVVKLGLRPKRRTAVSVKGMSNEAKDAREALITDPYNMVLINNLAYRYAIEGHSEKCANVMIRGWKRVNEFEDPSVRFCFLMKLCEVSYFLGQFRQALAVLQDIPEPDGSFERKAYLILACHVYGANKDIPNTLRTFQKAIEGEDYVIAVRIYALTIQDLRTAGVQPVARNAVEKLSPEADKDSTLMMLDGVANKDSSQHRSGEELQRYFLIAVIMVGVSMLLYGLYVLEQWSLASMKKK